MEIKIAPHIQRREAGQFEIHQKSKKHETFENEKVFYTYLGKACYWSSDLIQCIKLKEMTQSNVSWALIRVNEKFMVI